MEFPVISYNGAFIVGSKSGKIFLSNYFAREKAEDVRLVLAEHDIAPIVYAYIDGVERFSYVKSNVSNWMRFFLDSRSGDVRLREVNGTDDLYQGDIFYFSCIDNEEKLSPIYEIFKSDKRVQCIYQKDIYSGAQWCEILPEKATKANAALQLKEILGCDRMVAFGDGRNDLSLFSVADEGYAMVNAVPELKEIATAVIAANDQDGVARWIEENVL